MVVRSSLLSSALAVAILGGCGLVGIEPDEIDVNDDGASEGALSDSDTGLDDANTAGEGDGDGDVTSTGTGDGDGDDEADPSGCTPFEPADLSEGANAVEIVAGASLLSASCGGLGPEQVYRFVAPAAGDWKFEITESEFTEVLSLAEGCEPFTELVCAPAPGLVEASLAAEQVVFVIVDSEAGVGTAMLSIGPA